MKRTLLSLALAGLAAGAWAQTPQVIQKGADLKQDPIAMKYAKIISPELAKQHLSIIASDEFEGRETGQPGATKAAEYIAAEFKALGLKPIVNNGKDYFYDVHVVNSLFKMNSFALNGTPLTAGTEFTAQGGAGTKTLNAKDIVFIGYGIGAPNYDDLKGINIKGKIVMYISNGEPVKDSVSKITGTKTLSDWSGQRSRKRVEYIQSKKPLMLLAVNVPAPGGGGRGGRGGAGGGRGGAAGAPPAAGAGTPPAGAGATPPAAGTTPFAAALAGGGRGGAPAGRMGLAAEGEAPAITVTIPIATADMILKASGKTFAELKDAIDKSGTPQSMTIKADIAADYATTETPVKAVDVLGFLPGNDPKLKEEVLVISAHYDHIGLNTRPGAIDKVNNGADDDGSGTTGLLEIARAFTQAQKDGHGPKRSILFLSNVGEEKGLLGSLYYTNHPVIPLERTITDLNIDMIGRVGYEYIGKPDSSNYVYVIGSGMLSTDLHNAGERANQTYTNLKLDYKYDDLNDPNNFYQRSDHYNFAKHGVPIIFYFNGTHADYHQPGDEVSKIGWPMLAKRAQLVFYTAWDLLNAPKRPVVDQPIK